MKKSLLFGLGLFGALALSSCNFEINLEEEVTEYENSDVTFQTLEFEEEISDCERIDLLSKFYEKMKIVKSYQLENYEYELYGNFENYSYDKSCVTFYDDYFLKKELEIYNKENDNLIIICGRDTATIYDFIIGDTEFTYSDYKKYSDDDNCYFYSSSDEDSFYTDCFLDNEAFSLTNAAFYKKDDYYYAAYSKIDEEVNEITIGSDLKYEKNIDRTQTIVVFNEDCEAIKATTYEDHMSNRDQKTNEFLDDVVTYGRETSKITYKYGGRKARPSLNSVLDFTSFVDNEFDISLNVSTDQSVFNNYEPPLYNKKKNINEGECSFIIRLNDDNNYNSFMTDIELSYDYLVLTEENYSTDTKSMTVSLASLFDSSNILETADNEKYYYNDSRGTVLINFSYKFDTSTKELKIDNLSAKFINN